MLFRLFILATLTMLSVMLVEDITEQQTIMSVRQRAQYIQSFEVKRLRYFESAPHKAMIVWEYDPYVYFDLDFYITQDL